MGNLEPKIKNNEYPRTIVVAAFAKGIWAAVGVIDKIPKNTLKEDKDVKTDKTGSRDSNKKVKKV